MPRVIKRYENRKLYDTEASAYVSLEDVAGLVRGGETVEIVDNKSGDNLTAQVLMQIMLEEGKRGESLLPTDLLHDLVRRGGQAFDEGVEQLKQGAHDIVQGSLSRLGRLLPHEHPSELAHLRARLEHLETLMNRLLGDASAPPSEPESPNPKEDTNHG